MIKIAIWRWLTLPGIILVMIVAFGRTDPGVPVVQAAETRTYCTSPNAFLGTGAATQFFPLTISDSGAITDINLYVDVTYTPLSGLEFDLRHVATGTYQPLIITRCGGNSDLHAWFDDEAGGLVCVSPVSGTYAPPDGSLNVFDGLNVQDTWELVYQRHSAMATGTLHTWCLEVTVPSFSTAADTADWDPGDDRLNRQPAQPAAVYCREEGLHAYGPTGEPLLYASREAIEAAGVPTEGPRVLAANEAAGAGFFRLANGWFQLVVDNGAETYTFRWDGCPMTHAVTEVYSAAGDLLVYEAQ